MFKYVYNLCRYYDQLVAVEAKLPFTEDQVRISFTWYDAFAKGSMLSGKPKLNISLGSFEKACMLFNIAALQSQVASVQSRETDEGQKLSAKLFQVILGLIMNDSMDGFSYATSMSHRPLGPCID